MFAGNSWKYVELPEIWILSQSKKKQQPRLSYFFLCGNLSESVFGHIVHVQKPHTYSFVLGTGRSLCVCKRQSKKGVLLDFPQRDHHIQEARSQIVN